jgi:tetratricopeptide (TPR) repeat protein
VPTPLLRDLRNGHLAAVREAEGKFDEAAVAFVSLIDRSRRVRGEGHVDTLTAVNNHARLLYRQRQFAQAAAGHQEAIDAATKAPGIGPKHPLTLKYRHNLGTAEFGLRQFERADATLAEVYRLRRELLPPDHADTLQVAHDLGTLRVLVGRPAAALPVLADAYRGRRATLGLAHRDTASTATSWTRAVLTCDAPAADRAGAAAAAAEAIAAAPAKSPAVQALEGMLRKLEAREAAGAAYEARKRELAGRPAQLYELAMASANGSVAAGAAFDAVTPALDAAASARRLPEADRDPRLAQAWLLAGQSALSAGAFERAEPPLRAYYERTQGSRPDPYDAGVAANLLARCLTALGRYAEAEPLAVEGYDAIRANRKPGLPDAAWTGRALAAKSDIVKLYEKWGKSDKIKEWSERPVELNK